MLMDNPINVSIRDEIIAMPVSDKANKLLTHPSTKAYKIIYTGQ